MGKVNIQVGDYIENQDTKERFKIIEYQWTFCKECSKLPFMEFCEKKFGHLADWDSN